MAPAGTPAPIIARLNTEVNTALSLPEVREKLFTIQYDVRGGTAQEFGALIKGEIERFSKLQNIRLGD